MEHWLAALHNRAPVAAFSPSQTTLDLSPLNVTLRKLEYEMIGGRRPISKFINRMKHLSSALIIYVN